MALLMPATRLISVSTLLNSTAGAGYSGYDAGVTYPATSVGSKLQKRAYITDPPYNADPTGVADCTAAFSSAFANETNIFIPEGTYSLLGVPTPPTGSMTIEGTDRTVLLVKHTSARALYLTPASVDNRIRISNLTFQANASAVCPLGIEVVLPSVSSFTRSQCNIHDISFITDYSATTPFPNTWGRGIRITNTWFSVVERVYGGSYLDPNTTANTGFIEFTGGTYGNIATRIRDCEWTYGSDGVRMSAYTEGLDVQGCEFVGVTKGFNLPSTTPLGGSGGTLRGLSLWLSFNHVAATQACYDLDTVQDFRAIGHNSQRWANAAATNWRAFKLTDVNTGVISGGLLAGNEASGGITTVGIEGIGANSAHFAVTSNKFENLDTQFSLDASTSFWTFDDNRSTGSTSDVYTALGTNHKITWLKTDGTVNYKTNGLDGPIVTGSYTPTLTNVANTSTTSPYLSRYSRVGNMVTVFGRLDVTPTVTATLTRVGISLPVASDLSSIQQCCGAAGSVGEGTGGGVIGDVTNDRAELSFKSDSTSIQGWSYTFSYEVV
jgi:hypothetical protein